MKQIARIFTLACLPFAAMAQTQQEEEDKGYLAGLIEENLSGAGRTVTVNACEQAAGAENVLHLRPNSGTDLALFNAVRHPEPAGASRGAARAGRC